MKRTLTHMQREREKDLPVRLGQKKRTIDNERTNETREEKACFFWSKSLRRGRRERERERGDDEIRACLSVCVFIEILNICSLCVCVF